MLHVNINIIIYTCVHSTCMYMYIEHLWLHSVSCVELLIYIFPNTQFNFVASEKNAIKGIVS